MRLLPSRHGGDGDRCPVTGVSGRMAATVDRPPGNKSYDYDHVRGWARAFTDDSREATVAEELVAGGPFTLRKTTYLHLKDVSSDGEAAGVDRTGCEPPVLGRSPMCIGHLRPGRSTSSRATEVTAPPGAEEPSMMLRWAHVRTVREPRARKVPVRGCASIRSESASQRGRRSRLVEAPPPGRRAGTRAHPWPDARSTCETTVRPSRIAAIRDDS